MRVGVHTPGGTPDGAAGIPWVLGGLTVAAVAATVVGTVLPG